MKRFATLVAAVMLFAAFVSAQTMMGTISGEVRRPDGTPVPAATVTLTNLGTNTVTTVVTDNSGMYRATDLPAGRYSVSADLGNGNIVQLKTVEITQNPVTPSSTTTSTGQVTATVTVETEAPMVEKVRSQMNQTENTLGVLELPGRMSLNRLALQKPGVTPNKLEDPNSTTSVNSGLSEITPGIGLPRTDSEPVGQGFGSAFSVNGTRPNANDFTIDGQYNNDPLKGTHRQNIAPESMQTFEMITANMPAEFGSRQPGSFVDQITRTGNVGLHGTLMYTWAGNTFNSLSSSQKRSYNSLLDSGFNGGDAWRAVNPATVNNRALASGGFPIWKDRIFSFSSWDRDWFNSSINPSTFAISPTGIANLNALSNNLALTPFQTQFAPGSLNFLTNTFPTANVGTNLGSFTVVAPNGQSVIVPVQEFNTGLGAGGSRYDRDYWRFMQRMMFKISERNSLNARYLVDDLNDPGYPTAIFGQQVGQVRRDHSGGLNDVHIFSPTVINEARFSIGRLANRYDAFYTGIGVNIAGFNSINDFLPQNRKDTSYEWADNVSWSPTHHNFKFGFNALHYRMRDIFNFNPFGTVTFPSLTDVAFGTNAVFSQFLGNDVLRSNATSVGGFAQDDWRVTDTLSLNLGVRYDYAQVPEGFFAGIRPDRNNVSPRFGFAWAPGAGGRFFEKTVIRGGYTLAYNDVTWQLFPLAAFNFPNGINTVATGFTPATLFTGGLPVGLTPDQFIASGGNANLLPRTVVSPTEDGRLQLPYYQTYSLGVEREFLRDFVFRAYYLGTRGTHLYQMVERNPGISVAAFNANPGFFAGNGLLPVFAGSTLTSYRVDPTLGSISSLEPSGNSTYNSGQFSVEKRYSYGVQLRAQYTYSSFISTSDSFMTPLANPFDTRANRARSIYDQPHRFVGNAVFMIPRFSDNGWISRWVSGWEVSGITTAASGTPYSVYASTNALGLLPSANPSSMFFQLPTVGSNGAFFANPTNSGIIGNLGRNTLRTGRLINTDMAFVKSTKTFSENQSLQLRAEIFNIFNHRSYTGIPFNLVGASTNPLLFLNDQFTNAPGRSFMFTARYFF